MNHSYLLIGTSFGRLIRLIFRNGGLSFRYINRFLFLLQGSIWSSVFSIVEKIKFKNKLQNHPEVNNPVIIVGHWRTGSTFLHQLLSLDDQFTTPLVVRVSVPNSFLVSESYFRAIMNKVMSSTRPMDNVKLGPDEPQEDEYALLKTVKKTPLEKLIFPNKNQHFSHTLLQLNENNLSVDFVKNIKLFAKRLHYKKNGTVLFKNPFHSFRIKELKKIFPEARFIHIYRNPNRVIPSTVNMFNIIGRQNILKGKWKNEDLYTITKSFNHVWQCIKNQLFPLPEKDYLEIKYEDFEQDPKKYIKEIYNRFGFNYSENFDTKVDNFLQSVKNYKKNKFTLNEAETDHINNACADFLDHYNYKR